MSLTEPILQAIKTIVQSAIDNAPYDRTCMGQVVSVHPETNSCSVRINGKIYEKVLVYGNILSINVGDSVRVIIPSNQPSQMYIMSTGISIHEIGLKMHPVGSIYMTCEFNTAEQVSQAFGGTWIAWGSGRVPVGINSSDTDFNSVEKTGGWKNIQDHHHDYTQAVTGNIYTGEFESQHVLVSTKTTTTSGVSGTTTGASEGNNISGNLQPYIVCYMWKRIS